jgi:hypothetical protein
VQGKSISANTWATFIMLGFIIAGWAACSSFCNYANNTPEAKAAAAQAAARRETTRPRVACESELSRMLKDPDSAKVEDEVTKVGDGYLVTMSVRAKNSFGAFVRESYTCTYANGSAVVVRN